MINNELIESIEEILEVEKGTLSRQDKLQDYPEWDSLAIISFLALVDTKYGKTIDSKIMKNVETVDDLINLL